MKATIDETGKLSVIPENAMETFALKQWWKDYQEQSNDVGGEEHFAVLEVVIIEAPNA